jgi:hypothetical protein
MSFVPRPFARPTYVRPAVGDPVPVVPQAVGPRALDPQAVIPREPTRLTLSVRTATEAACGALRDAVGALDGAPASWPADEPRDSDRWADAGGPRAPAGAGCPVAESDAADDRFRRGPARSAHDEAPSAARDVAYAALGAYARALRHDGTPFATALAILGTAVDDAAEVEAAGLLAPAVLAAVQRDAAQCCRAAFAAP